MKTFSCLHAFSLFALTASLLVIGCGSTDNGNNSINHQTSTTGGGGASSGNTVVGSGGGNLGPVSPDNARVLFLHHSVGKYVQLGGNSGKTFATHIKEYNQQSNHHYTYNHSLYPDTEKNNSYGWDNKPFVYWDMWVNRPGGKVIPKDEEFSSIANSADLVIFKHCFTESGVAQNKGSGTVSEDARRIEVYKLQYEAIKAKMKAQSDTKFLVWTLPPKLEGAHTREAAALALEFSNWVRDEWDEKGDNIFVFDYRTLSADKDGLFLPKDWSLSEYSGKPDNHPSSDFSGKVLNNFVQRTIDVLEGRGDTAPVTGLDKLAE